MSNLSKNNKKIFLISLHKLIEDVANITAVSLEKGESNQIFYPPNGGLSNDEKNALNALISIPYIKSALRKVLADNSSKVIFDLLNWFDGTGDPDTQDWRGITIVDKSSENEESSMLHDQFMDMYWEWKKIRKNTEWKLDLKD